MKVKIRKGRLWRKKIKEYEIKVKGEMPEEAGRWIPKDLTYTDLMGQPKLLDGLKQGARKFFDKEYLHGVLARIWNGTQGKRFPQETQEDYLKRVFSGYKLKVEESREGNQHLIARERTGFVPFRKRFTELEFRVDEVGTLTYQGFRDNVRMGEGERVKAKVDGKAKKREWPGMKKISKIAGMIALGFPLIYTIADILLNQPEPVNFRRISSLRNLAVAVESGDTKTMRKYYAEWRGLGATFHPDLSYLSDEEIRDSAKMTIDDNIFYVKYSNYNEVIGSFRFPVKLEALTVVIGRQPLGKSTNLFLENLEGAIDYRGVIRINETQGFSLSSALALENELWKQVYIRLLPEKRAEIRMKTGPRIERLIRNHRLYASYIEESGKLFNELTHIINNELGLAKNSGSLSEPDYDDFIHSPNELIPRGFPTNNSDLLLKIRNLRANPLYVSKRKEYLRMSSKFNIAVANPLLSVKGGDSVPIRRSTTLEFISEWLASNSKLAAKRDVHNTANMFGVEFVNKGYNFDFGLENKHLPANITILNKSWDNFWQLYWLNLSAPIKYATLRWQYGDFLREEAEDTARVERIARLYGIKDTWKDKYIPGYTQFRDFHDDLALGLGVGVYLLKSSPSKSQAREERKQKYNEFVRSRDNSRRN